MKTHMGFISNSSSSSFILEYIPTDKVTDLKDPMINLREIFNIVKEDNSGIYIKLSDLIDISTDSYEGHENDMDSTYDVLVYSDIQDIANDLIRNTLDKIKNIYDKNFEKVEVNTDLSD